MARIQAEETLIDRTGQFEYPVLICLLDGQGYMFEQVCCRICADLTPNVVSERAAAVASGETCPLCNADLSPV